MSKDGYIRLLSRRSNRDGWPHLLGVLEANGALGLRELTEAQLRAYAAEHGLIEEETT